MSERPWRIRDDVNEECPGIVTIEDAGGCYVTDVDTEQAAIILDAVNGMAELTRLRELEAALLAEEHVFHPHGWDSRFVECGTQEEEGEPPCPACVRVKAAFAACRAARKEGT